ncbi:IclR family transcriptional regulator domain-containing protein, partial [Bacillus pumilus]
LDIRRIARPFMEGLRDEVGEAVQLIVREGDEAIYVDKIEGTQPVRLYTAVGRRSPLYCLLYTSRAHETLYMIWFAGLWWYIG